jgi:phosphoglycolate phosphatase
VTNDTSATRRLDTAVLDIDGTLIDSVYAHVWSWREAFRVLGTDVPAWRVHRAIGMGGDRLVGALTSEAVESAIGDEVRSWQKKLYRDVAEHLAPTHGALDLLEAFRRRGLAVVLASSGARENIDHAVDVLEARRYITSTVSGDDTDATKPDDEPVRRAVESVGGADALVVGDAVWDIEAARRAGYPAIGLQTGGISRCELLAAGAVDVFEDPAELASVLGEVLDRMH